MSRFELEPGAAGVHGSSSLRERVARRVVVLDGGTATSLEAAGHDLHDELWSARLLLDDPDAVVDVHRAFLDAGAEVVTTASYQLAARSLAASGRDPASATRFLAASVALARRAVTDHLAARASDVSHRAGARTPALRVAGSEEPPGTGVPERPLVAASVGPYGAVLANGSEYRGRYGRSVDDLVAFHAPRVAALVEAGADVLACETIPSAGELAALARVVRGCGVEVVVSVTVGADGTTTAEGQPLLAAVAPLLELDEVVAVGANCCPPQLVAPALTALADAERPLVAKPNAGARWDAVARRWVAPSAAVEPVDPVGWVEAGARLVGGCCGTSPEDLRQLVGRLASGRGP